MPPPYKAVGRCIYCGAKPRLSELSGEHIIPRNIGGKLVLPKASCLDCARETSQFEKECVRAFFGPVRKHLDIRGNKQKKRHSHIRAEIAPSPGHSHFEMMPIGEYPSFLWSFLFLPPGILAGIPRDEEIRGTLHFVDLNPDGPKSGESLILGGNLSAKTYARLLAKIGHAYAAAECGIDNFKPYLTDLIRGISPNYPAFFVGCKLAETPPQGKIPPAGKERHEIELESAYLQRHVGAPLERSNYLIVRIRLFSELGAPVYYVVAGERLVHP